jgi:hypothetical protein
MRTAKRIQHAIDFDKLGKAQLDVACSRRHVDDQDIETVTILTPVYLKEKLLDSFHDHETPPDDGRVRAGGKHEAHRHAGNSVVRQGNEATALSKSNVSRTPLTSAFLICHPLFTFCQFGFQAFETHELGNTGSKNVEIE